MYLEMSNFCLIQHNKFRIGPVKRTYRTLGFRQIPHSPERSSLEKVVASRLVDTTELLWEERRNRSCVRTEAVVCRTRIRLVAEARGRDRVEDVGQGYFLRYGGVRIETDGEPKYGYIGIERFQTGQVEGEQLTSCGPKV
jgi:hypothetical protein